MANMTPAEWLALLEKRLDARWARMRTLDDYFEGRHPMAFATSQFREAFGALLATMSDNWCQIVVTSSARRLKVQGFRFGDADGADDAAWAIWQANGMDAQASLVHTEAIKLGESYWLVEPPMNGREYPRITCEHPQEMIVAHAPGDRRTRLAALKRWPGDDGYWYATLYLPDRVWKLRSQQKRDKTAGGSINWTSRPGDEGGQNPLRLVPVVPICNAPTMLGGGTSDLAPGIPLQNAIDKLCADMLVASEFAAFRQRVMSGVELPPPGTPERAEIMSGVARMLTVEDPDAKVYDLPATDLKNYVNAIEMFIQHLAAQTNTPPHYLLGSMVNISGDALAAAESGLVSKVESKKEPIGEGHEDAMRLAFLSMGDTAKAGADDAETLWAPSERRSFAQVVDGAVKLAQIGFPPETVMEELGWSPQRIAQVQAQMITADVFAPLKPPGAPAPGANDAAAPNAGV
jgi:hypothetical protein